LCRRDHAAPSIDDAITPIWIIVVVAPLPPPSVDPAGTHGCRCHLPAVCGLCMSSTSSAGQISPLPPNRFSSTPDNAAAQRSVVRSTPLPHRSGSTSSPLLFPCYPWTPPFMDSASTHGRRRSSPPTVRGRRRRHLLWAPLGSMDATAAACWRAEGRLPWHLVVEVFCQSLFPPSFLFRSASCDSILSFRWQSYLLGQPYLDVEHLISQSYYLV
jgi:hypothetical protein